MYEEFFEQGDLEKQLGRTPAPLFDRSKATEIPKQQVVTCVTAAAWNFMRMTSSLLISSFMTFAFFSRHRLDTSISSVCLSSSHLPSISLRSSHLLKPQQRTGGSGLSFSAKSIALCTAPKQRTLLSHRAEQPRLGRCRHHQPAVSLGPVWSPESASVVEFLCSCSMTLDAKTVKRAAFVRVLVLKVWTRLLSTSFLNCGRAGPMAGGQPSPSIFLQHST